MKSIGKYDNTHSFVAFYNLFLSPCTSTYCWWVVAYLKFKFQREGNQGEFAFQPNSQLLLVEYSDQWGH